MFVIQIPCRVVQDNPKVSGGYLEKLLLSQSKENLLQNFFKAGNRSTICTLQGISPDVFNAIRAQRNEQPSKFPGIEGTRLMLATGLITAVRAMY